MSRSSFPELIAHHHGNVVTQILRHVMWPCLLCEEWLMSNTFKLTTARAIPQDWWPTTQNTGAKFLLQMLMRISTSPWALMKTHEFLLTTHESSGIPSWGKLPRDCFCEGNLLLHTTINDYNFFIMEWPGAKRWKGTYTFLVSVSNRSHKQKIHWFSKHSWNTPWCFYFPTCPMYIVLSVYSNFSALSSWIKSPKPSQLCAVSVFVVMLIQRCVRRLSIGDLFF